ncbi:hypothetical protein Q4F19_08440 [Sphingomonas sp. BIUV-7]|uniref:Uncharacterized protein n=1 Tax=Sphingomonas natans TaxID=3063330 RepID=A0ABT8Y7W2_9SPHN|nr:hypothetical protein [Sphingomonas sp. BIUV-7]MDO6414407.1 hypothetical protein [Sphingomonas sp. BIUV-7]
MISMLSPSGIKAAWTAYRPAPESAPLRKLRIKTMLWNGAAALSVAGVDLLVRLHPAMVLIVAGVAVQAVAITIRYWRIKNRTDREFQAASAPRDGQSPSTKNGDGGDA